MRGEWMEQILEWVRSLVYFLILMTMLGNLLPDKKYEKYLSLFVGMVFLMLVLSPFADLTGVEARTAEAFARLTFQNDAKLLRREIEDAESERMKKLVEGYEAVIIEDIRQIAEELEAGCKEIRVRLDEDLDRGTFGRVIAVDMVVSKAEAVADLRRRIGGYYGMEERTIAIHLEDE